MALVNSLLKLKNSSKLIVGTFISMSLISDSLFVLTLSPCAAKELIKGLLKTNPGERFKIDDVLKHRWIAVSSCTVTVETGL